MVLISIFLIIEQGQCVQYLDIHIYVDLSDVRRG